jgi:hypothetical protein
MLCKALTLSLLGAVASAQTSVVSLFLLDTDPQALVASVISANPSTTQYVVGCPTGAAADECGYNPPETVKHAGSVYGASLTAAEEQFTMSYECTIYTTSGTSAVCTTSAGGEQANFPGVGTTTLVGSDVAFFPVTVTAGADQLASQTGSTAKGTGSGSAGAASTASSNSAPTAGVGIGLAGLAAIAMAL